LGQKKLCQGEQPVAAIPGITYFGLLVSFEVHGFSGYVLDSNLAKKKDARESSY
jgi:hypothetical protein